VSLIRTRSIESLIVITHVCHVALLGVHSFSPGDARLQETFVSVIVGT